MPTTDVPRWQDLDPATRAELDEEFLRELEGFVEGELTEEGRRIYLDYRHERPVYAITTFEEGRLRTMLRAFRAPETTPPDVVAQEEHVGRLETFGASRLHLTNAQTYLVIMLVGTFALIALWVAWALA